MSRVVPILALCVLGAGCARDPLDVPCPDVGAGGLVVTEIRGPQTGTDAYGEWIELYNASGGPVDLRGLRVTVTRLDGSNEVTMLVRSGVVVGEGAYAVLGDVPPGAEPGFIDYGYSGGDAGELYDTAAVELASCGEVLDLAIYRNLPSKGTFAFDGDLEPSAEGNDDERAWCIDDAEDIDTPALGTRGTPRERNRPCAD